MKENEIKKEWKKWNLKRIKHFQTIDIFKIKMKEKEVLEMRKKNTKKKKRMKKVLIFKFWIHKSDEEFFF